MAVLPYFIIERGVWAMLNALKSDNVADAETSYRVAALVSDTHLVNPLFNPTAVRNIILNVERVIAKTICSIEGHPRRVDFRKEVTLTHWGNLPSSIGGIGLVYDNDDKIYYDNRPFEVVMRLRQSDSIIKVCQSAPPTYHYWGWDGAKFVSTTDDDLTAEVFDPQTPAIDAFTDYDALFSSSVPVNAKLPDEFQQAWELGAAGVAASKIGTYPNESSSYLQQFQGLLEQEGVKIKLPLDFESTESPAG